MIAKDPMLCKRREAAGHTGQRADHGQRCSTPRGPAAAYAGASAKPRTAYARASDKERVEKLIEAAKGNRWGHRDASQDAFEASERNLPKFVNARSTVKGCL